MLTRSMVKTLGRTHELTFLIEGFYSIDIVLLERVSRLYKEIS